MKKILNTKETFFLLENVRKYINKISISIIIFVLSSFAFLLFCFLPKSKFENENIALIICIAWSLVFISISILIIISAYDNRKKFIKIINQEICTYEHGGEYLKYFKNNITKTCKVNLIFSFLLLIIETILIFTLLSFKDLYSSYYYFLLSLSTFNIGFIFSLFTRYFVKNKYSKKIIYQVFTDENKDDNYNLKNAYVSNIIAFLVYWFVTIIIYVLFGYYTDAWYSAWIIIVISLLFYIIKSFIINPFGKWRIFERKKTSTKITKYIVIILMCVGIFYLMSAGSWYIQPYVSSISEVSKRKLAISYDEENGIFKIKNEKNTSFKILQLTDINIGGSFVTKKKDELALQTIYELVKETKPDLIIVTGDIVYPVAIQSFNFNNSIPFFQFLTFMDNMNIPWSFVYGNHDTEVFATNSHTELATNLNYYSYTNSTDNVLLYSTKKRNIYGRSNQLIEIDNYDNSINQLLFLLDSNSYISGITDDYDYIRDDQVKWYENELKRLSKETILPNSMLFFHIPLVETKEAIDMMSTNENVKFINGTYDEEVNCSKVKSKIFTKALELGSTKAMFYGHDHLNNISLMYQGIRLTYGMSIDYLATPGISDKTAQRGATLITLKEKGEYEVEQIVYKELKNGNN